MALGELVEHVFQVGCTNFGLSSSLVLSNGKLQNSTAIRTSCQCWWRAAFKIIGNITPRLRQGQLNASKRNAVRFHLVIPQSSQFWDCTATCTLIHYSI